MRVVTLDIETYGDVSRGNWKPEDLELTICCIHDSETDSYDSFLKEELPKLWKVLEHTDVLVGFNSDHFDIPVLNKYYPGDLSKIRSIDLLKEISAVLGRRVRLDAIAEGTLGKKKIANGLQAMKWWKEGEIKKLREYCLKDVEVTKGIFDYALKNGSLHFKELGIKKEVKLDTSQWLAPSSAASLTKTLGF
ncbi:MAG TPA: ribonuclease H-like domain-containing protein [Candidatus Paceibacterota bacterium]|nr:ribonuclease H-like domain-containing protein [Candidatus Paceibacterota bacterium]